MRPPLITFSRTWYIAGSRFFAQKFDDPTDMPLMERVSSHGERIGPLSHHRGEGTIELIGTANRDKHHLHAQRRCRSFPLFEVGSVRRVVWIPEKSEAGDGRNDLFEKLQPFGRDLRPEDGIAGDIR